MIPRGGDLAWASRWPARVAEDLVLLVIHPRKNRVRPRYRLRLDFALMAVEPAALEAVVVRKIEAYVVAPSTG